MTVEEALIVLDTALKPGCLSNIQEIIFRKSWEGLSYLEIADFAGYDASYIKDVGYKLWQLLSTALGEKVTKSNLQAVIGRRSRQRAGGISRQVSVESRSIEIEKTPQLQPQVQLQEIDNRQHWGEIVDVSTFYGRSEELAQLQQWIATQSCRLVTLVGMGGIGKTSLAAKVAIALQQDFDFLIWQPLRNAPPLEDVLSNLIQILSHQQDTALATSLEAQISQLMGYLRSSRCLLILDNVDAILGSADETTSPAGQYQSGYSGYGEMLRRVGSEYHSSCLVLTSREKPTTLIPLEGETSPVRTLPLIGLSSLEVREILQANGCFSETENDWLNLSQHYCGNPLALKIVSTTVRDLFDGNITKFLEHGAIAFGDINVLLDGQFCRLSNLEKQVMYWLAINREWVTLAELRQDFIAIPSQSKLLDALLSLRGRSLIEKNAGQFTLQPVVMEYVTEQLIDRVYEEIKTIDLALFASHALIKAEAKDYIRESQVRTILSPLAERLMGEFRSKKEVEYQLNEVLFQVRSRFPNSVGYAGGNLINLLRQLKIELSGYDFSHLSIWQAYLIGASLHRVNFAYTDLSKSVFTSNSNGAMSVAFSPDGKFLAVGNVDGRIRVCRTEDYRDVLTCEGHNSWIACVAFSPISPNPPSQGGILASACFDHRVKLWDLSTGKCIQTLAGHTGWAHSVAFSPIPPNPPCQGGHKSDPPNPPCQGGQPIASQGGQGGILASGSWDCTIKLWDVTTGECLKTLQGHTSFVMTVIFSPDGQLLASCSYDQTVKLWQVETGQLINTLTGHTHAIRSIAFSPDGQTLVSGSWDCTVRLWEVSTGRCLKILKGHTDPVAAVAFSPDGGAIASASYDCTVRLWDVATGQCAKIMQKHSGWIWSIAFHPQGHTLASGSLDRTVTLWNAQTGESLRTLHGYSAAIRSVAFSPDGQLLASGSDDTTIEIWNVQSGDRRKTLQGHTNWVWCVAFSPDGQILASSSNSGMIRLWDVATGQLLRVMQGGTSIANIVFAVSFSRDGRMLASSDNAHTLRLWDVQTGECFKVLSDNCRAWSIALSPDGAILASGSDDKLVRLWDVGSGECLKTLSGHTSLLFSVAFSPDGNILASSGDDRLIKLWDIRSGECLNTLQGHGSLVWSVRFSLDGCILVSGSHDKTIKLWDVRSGECLKTLQGDSSEVWAIATAPDGRTLASGSADGAIALWEIETGDRVRTMRSPRLYEGMNIMGVTGVTEAQKSTLKALGAVEIDALGSINQQRN